VNNFFKRAVLGLALCLFLSPLVVVAGTAEVPTQDQLESRIAVSGKSPKIIVNQEKFAEQLFTTATIELGYTLDPVNNLYVFFDPMCSNCQSIKTQLINQSKLYSEHKVNVQIIPVCATKEGRIKAVHLYVDDPDYLEASVLDIQTFVNLNTELYRTSFENIGTPLVVWQTEKGFEVLKGFPSQSTNNAFLETVARKKGVANWMMELSGVKG